MTGTLQTASRTPVIDAPLQFNIGQLTKVAQTDGTGQAVVSFELSNMPGEMQAQVTYSGSANNAATAISTPFTLYRQATAIDITADQINQQLVVTLTDANGDPIRERTLFLIITGSTVGTLVINDITDYFGRIILPFAPTLPPGEYSVAAYFNGTIPLPSGDLTLDNHFYEGSTENATVTVYSETAISLHGISEHRAVNRTIIVIFSLLTLISVGVWGRSWQLKRQPAKSVSP